MNNNQTTKNVFQLGLVKFTFIYSLFFICVIFAFDIFKPLRLEVTISLIACCVIPLVIHFFDYQHEGSTHNEIRWQSLKLHLWASFIFLALVPFFCTDKISTLFYPTQAQAERIQPAQSGYLFLGEVRIPTHRQPVEGVIFGSDTEQPVLCDLLSRKHCPYTQEFDKKARVQLSNRELWPYINRAVVFSFQTDQLNFNQEQHIRFYQQQKYAVMFYFIFIFFPSFWLFYKLRSTLLNHYFKTTTNTNPKP